MTASARPAPTPFIDLNEVLAELVGGTQALLGANFVGAYLQGSFALGDGDEYSDVDFIIVTHDDLPDSSVPALDAMHQAVNALPCTWAQHLEGSYAPAGILRSLAGAPREVPGAPRPPGWIDPMIGGRPALHYPLLYLNNGARCLVRSEHDNTQVMRWVLRERGIALSGPPASELVNPVSAHELCAEVRDMMRSFGHSLLDGEVTLDALWLQGFTVLFFCRILQSLATAAIPSKPAAMRWAKAHLDPEWHGLIDRAWEGRARYPRGRGAPEAHAALSPPPGEVALTLEFVRYALDMDARIAHG